MIHLTHSEVNVAARKIAIKMAGLSLRKAYPIPRGGIPAAYLVKAHYEMLDIVESPEQADCYIDDLFDSGATSQRFSDKPFFALFTKNPTPKNVEVGALVMNQWIVFPWESSMEGSAEDICTRLLQFIGEDPNREGLRETPKRMLKAWKFWTQGYSMDPADLLKVFEDGAEGCDEMVVVKDIPVYSHCEHHLAMIIGTAHVGYIPNGKIVGLSKLARMVDMYARRLQVQERLTNQIAEAINTHLEPLGVAVMIRARHMCMESRGVEKPGAETVTQAVRGVFKNDPATRAEFMALVR